MNSTKARILETALRIYNERGVARTSMRQMAKEVGISHSNLIYHFPSHEEIVLGLHDQLLHGAIQLNSALRADDLHLTSLLESTRTGFAMAYNYRFLFLELHYLCAAYPQFKAAIVAVESIRSAMYRSLIDTMVDLQHMRPEEYQGEYNDFIQNIKLFSDHWIVSTTIYDNLESSARIDKYALQLIQMFYPYLTPVSKEAFHSLCP